MEQKFQKRVVLCWLVVLLAPVLTFAAQPMVGKFVLPVHGGAASSWLTSLLFFQTCVLLGYVFAGVLLRFSGKIQALGMVLLGGLSLLLGSFAELGDTGLGVFGGLCIGLLLPMVFLFSLSLVMQEWLYGWRGKVPWYLYALSNVGSLGALVCYPFWIEPEINLESQVGVWRGLLSGIVLFVGLLACCRWGVEKEKVVREKVGWRRLGWLSLAFVPCLLLMAATLELTSELGSHPLVWGIPLAAYLGSFGLVFAGFWGKKLNALSGLGAVVCLVLYVYEKGLELNFLTLNGIAFLLGTVVFGCVFLHGVLYGMRPKRYFVEFYILIAAGGLLAGVFSVLVAPALFTKNLELYVAFLGLLGVCAWRVWSWRGWVLGVLTFVSVLGACGWALYEDWNDEKEMVETGKRTYLRSLYGKSVLEKNGSVLLLKSEATTHGIQVMEDEWSRLPTTYYHVDSPVGSVFRYLQAQPKKRHIGVIGLGVGTLAAYAQPGDTVRFWEIDPVVADLAQEEFRFLEECHGEVKVEMKDGRVGVRECEKPLDVLVVDAFSGDAVPTHLLTQEAFGEFLDQCPDGWLAFHISSRWYSLASVMHENLKVHDRVGFMMVTKNVPEHERVHHSFANSYVIVPPRNEVRSFLKFVQEYESKRNPVLSKVVVMPDPNEEGTAWTDEKHSVTEVISWKLLWKAWREK